MPTLKYYDGTKWIEISGSNGTSGTSGISGTSGTSGTSGVTKIVHQFYNPYVGTFETKESINEALRNRNKMNVSRTKSSIEMPSFTPSIKREKKYIVEQSCGTKRLLQGGIGLDEMIIRRTDKEVVLRICNEEITISVEYFNRLKNK